ncbi:MAG: hypothetical protein Q7T96_10145 [Methylobacter sp.]|nr:hypothetical protein [Methylobacter sp.]
MAWFDSLLKRLKHRETSLAWTALGRLLLLASIALNLPGCASFGPSSMDRDRFDYINALASSWKQQTLLNIVKMRYADTPVFLEVGQIISGYQLQGAVTVSGTLNSASAVGDILNLGSAATYIDRPTITYTPLTGANFLQVLMTPIPPPALFRLAEQGWPVDLLLQVGVQSINGVSNRKGGARGHAADPDFVALLAAFQRLQSSGALGLRVEMSKETKQEGTVLVISRKDLPPEVEADRSLVRKLLGLRSDVQEFKVVYGSVPEKDDVVAVQTRSGFQILNLLGSTVEAPPEHIAERRTYPQFAEPEGAQPQPPLITVHADNLLPADAFAAVKYRDYWYWIDDRDFRSKSVFSFLMIIMTLADTGEKVQPPVVTIQGN